MTSPQEVVNKQERLAKMCDSLAEYQFAFRHEGHDLRTIASILRSPAATGCECVATEAGVDYTMCRLHAPAATEPYAWAVEEMDDGVWDPIHLAFDEEGAVEFCVEVREAAAAADEEDDLRLRIHKLYRNTESPADTQSRRLALRNCLTLARRRINKASPDSEWWTHVIRFCAQAGEVPNVLRDGSAGSDPLDTSNSVEGAQNQSAPIAATETREAAGEWRGVLRKMARDFRHDGSAPPVNPSPTATYYDGRRIAFENAAARLEAFANSEPVPTRDAAVEACADDLATEIARRWGKHTKPELKAVVAEIVRHHFGAFTAAVEGWRPIESAPRDRQVWTWDGKYVYALHWRGTGWGDSMADHEPQPILWQPFAPKPSPPESAT